MSQTFVRYGPDVEQEEPDFESTLQAVLDDMKQHMRGSLTTEGIGLVVCNAHAKTGFHDLLTDVVTGKGTFDAGQPDNGRMAGRALSLRDGWTGTCPAPGHFGDREFREDGCACVQPVAGTGEHRPLGEIMQVRRIYSASAKVRRTLNHQPHTEPASADEVLPYPVAPSLGSTKQTSSVRS